MARPTNGGQYTTPAGAVAPGSDDHDYSPKMRTVPASTIRKGDVILESDGHPARVLRVSKMGRSRSFWCRYLWQTPAESEWSTREYPATYPVAKKVR